MSEGYTVNEALRPYFELICHNYKPSNHVRVAPFFKALLGRVSSRMKCRGLAELREARDELPDNEKPIYIHVGRHLSEIDWMEGQYLFHKQGMGALISAGDNLFVPPFGGFLKSMGAFVALRSEATIKGTKIDKRLAARLYGEYFRHAAINEGHDILVYPEWTTLQTSNGRKTKYGRSYSGEFLEFSPLIFRIIKSVQAESERPVLVVPHNASRERVIEDQIFGQLAKMKDEGRSKRAVFLKDLGFVCTHWLYQRPGAVDFNFGKPIPADQYSAKELTQRARLAVAELQTIFPTHIFAYAMGKDTQLETTELEDRMAQTIDHFIALGLRVDCHNAWKSLQRAYEQFCQKLFWVFPTREVVTSKKGVLKVERPDVLHQYRDNARSLEQILQQER